MLLLLKRLAMQLTPARSGRQPEGCAHQLVFGVSVGEGSFVSALAIESPEKRQILFTLIQCIK